MSTNYFKFYVNFYNFRQLVRFGSSLHEVLIPPLWRILYFMQSYAHCIEYTFYVQSVKQKRAFADLCALFVK